VTDSVALKGTLTIGGGTCVSGGCGGAGDQSVKSLALRCASGQVFQTVVETASPIAISTPGLIGAAFADLDILGDLTSIELLYVRTDRQILLRVGAAPAVVTGVGGLFPTLFVGGETLTLTIDGTPVSVAFLVGDQTAAQCAARINAACALAGLATPRAVVASSGQIAISGVLTGAQGTVVVTGGTGAAALGMTGLSAVGLGADVPVYGTMLIEFGVAGQTSPPLPSRIQVSGLASITVVAAGTSS
jgi:hypothetical protein